MLLSRRAVDGSQDWHGVRSRKNMAVSAKSLDGHLYRGNVELARRNLQGRLEAGPRRGLVKDAHGAAVGPGLSAGKAPFLDSGVSVPAGKQLHHAGAVLGREGGRLGRVARPVEPKGAVVLHIVGQKAAVQAGVEDNVPVRRILSDLAFGAPVDQDIAARQRLKGPLGLGQDAVVRRVEGLDQLGGAAVVVDGDVLATRVGVDFDVSVLAGRLGAVDGVVEEGNEVDGAVAAGQVACVVLEAKLDARTELEAGLVAAQAPDDIPVGGVDLEDGGRVPGRQEVVAVIALGDGVDVEVVPGGGAVVARPRQPPRQRQLAVWKERWRVS